MMEQVKRKRGRPRKNTPDSIVKAVRPKRVPFGAQREILAVSGKDPNYHYRWVLDKNENGNRIMRFLRAGYSFVASDTVTVGDELVLKTTNYGSIVRQPGNSTGEFLYLMKLPMEYHLEDNKAKQDAIDETENQMRRALDEGQYGKVNISRNPPG